MLKTKLFFTLLNLVNTSYLSQKLDVNYDKRLSPYYLNRNAVNVSLSIPYLLLIDVVEDAQLVSWLVTFTITWRDDRLKYNPAQNGGETKMFVPNTEVWTPRFIVYNSIEHRKLIEDEKNDVSISPVGQVKLQITQFINIICDIQVERMPFDTQFCSFRIVSPLQSQKYTFLQGHLEKQTAMFRGNSEFHLSNVSVSEYDYEMDEDEMHEIYFETELIRRPNYFIIVIVIPSFLISTMTITGILLPVHQGVGGDAITVGLASMLALSITLSIVAETLPRTSNIPLIGAYILACLIICSLAVIFGLLLTHFKNSNYLIPKVFTRRLCTESDKDKKGNRDSRQSSINDDSTRVYDKRKIITGLYTTTFCFLQASLFITIIIFFSFSWSNPPRPSKNNN